MFGWGKPVCPCEGEAKAWIEDKLRWLSQQFGLNILTERPIILPTAEFFPDPWDASQNAVRAMFDRVCRYMNVDPDRVDLRFKSEYIPEWQRVLSPNAGYAAATWQMRHNPNKPAIVTGDRSIVDNPSDLVGSLAHELSHEKLLGERRKSSADFDNELLTDLTAIYHGFGIFLANNPRKHLGKISYWPNSKSRKPEYISEPMAGYALAHIAWFRDETKPAWAKHLRWTPRSVFKQGLKFLNETSASTFKPARLRD